MSDPFHKNGLKYMKAGKWHEAEMALAEALARDEGNAALWADLGETWIRLDRASEARDAFQMSLGLNPALYAGLYGMGVAEIACGDERTGLAYLEKAYSQTPSVALGLRLGESYYERENYDKAAHYLLAGQARTSHSDALVEKLSASLYKSGKPEASADILTDLLLKHPESTRYANALAEFLSRTRTEVFDIRLRQALVTCLKLDHVKHRYLASQWAALFLLDPDLEPLRAYGENGICGDGLIAALNNPFLLRGLEKIPVVDADIEQILCAVRRRFLLDTPAALVAGSRVTPFLSALAIQNWHNDFVFYVSDEEALAVVNLKHRVAALSGVLTDEQIYLPALLGCYIPLTWMAGSVETPSLLRELWRVQVENPERERVLAGRIPSFATVEDQTSRNVRAMYESRPYPRWRSTGRSTLPADFAALSRGLDVLVAGCGTGQEPALLANSLPEGRITAIDLSLSSLAYAQRMADELDISNRIEFLQGDLLEIGRLNRQFDLIVSSGVLHHMAEPEKGLAALLSILKPGGRLSLSLYSRIARDTMLGPADAYIKERGYSASDDDIRRFRRDVMALDADDPVRRCTRAADFFFLAECNDLLFHIQEHRTTLPELKDLAERFDLELLGLNLDPLLQHAYRQRFGSDASFADWDRLDIFERENPRIFMSMYKMSFRRRGDTGLSPVDALAQRGLI